MEDADEVQVLDKKLEELWVFKLGLQRGLDFAKLASTLIHPSALARKKNKQVEYQRKEWLGDAILYFNVSSFLYKEHPEYDEEKLSRMRTRIIRESGLALFAREVGLDALVYKSYHTPNVDAVIADTVEALIGAVYLEAGESCARGLCRKVYDVVQNKLGSDPAVSPKSLLSEWTRAALWLDPQYNTYKNSAEDADISKQFVCDLAVGDNIAVRGYGRSKIKAEEHAAAQIFESPRELQTLHDGDFSVHNAKNQLARTLALAKLGSFTSRILPRPGPINAPFIVEVSVPKLSSEAFSGYGVSFKEAEKDAIYTILRILKQRGYEITEDSIVELADKFESSLGTPNLADSYSLVYEGLPTSNSSSSGLTHSMKMAEPLASQKGKLFQVDTTSKVPMGFQASPSNQQIGKFFQADMDSPGPSMMRSSYNQKDNFSLPDKDSLPYTSRVKEDSDTFFGFSNRQNSYQSNETLSSGTPTAASSFSRDAEGPVSFNPKGKLQEMLVKYKVTPKYNLISRDGPDHEPVFVAEVVFDYQHQTYKQQGNGRTKRSAEEDAASKMVRLLTAQPLRDPFEASLEYRPTEAIFKSMDINPVGALFELAATARSSGGIAPEFRFDASSPEGGMFACEVYLKGQFMGRGVGSNKQEAKGMAARKALKKILGT